MFKGVYPALITPFTKNNLIDKERFKNLINFVEKGKVKGVVTCGTTGESPTLSIAEHKELIDITVEYAKQKAIVGTGSNNTIEAIELTKYGEDAGADAALLISPYYNKPNNKGLIKHFKLIADSSNIPLILYNVPFRTGQDLPLEVIIELSKVNNIVAIKEASGNLDKVSQIIEHTKDEDFSVLSGDDGLTLPIMALGGTGVISVAANIIPNEMSQLVDYMLDGKINNAKEIHYKIASLIRSLFMETNPIPIKRAMELMNLADGHLRLPLDTISQENEKILLKTLKNMECI